MRFVHLIGFVGFFYGTLFASSASQEVRLHLKPDIRIVGAEDGYQKQTGYLIPWVFGDHRSVYFWVSFFNDLKDKSLETGDLGKMVRLDKISRLGFKGQCPEEVEVIQETIEIPSKLRLVGAMRKGNRQNLGLWLPALDSSLPIPTRLDPYQNVYLLFAVDFDAPLPPGDYDLRTAFLLPDEYPRQSQPIFFRIGSVSSAYDRLHDRLYQAWIAAVFGKEKQERKAMKSLVKVASGVPLSWMTVAYYFDVNCKDPKTALKYAREGLKRFPCTAEERNFVPANDSFQVQCGLGTGIFVDAGDMWVSRPCFERYVENLRERIAAQSKEKTTEQDKKQ